ncbi:glycosyltransferase [Anabaena sp. UHCC 0187]|uniref:glycosyltransferase family 2 protein n=1 Tax=Anabaena sp. UHCC 0187 TaxID=2590018 RepID=UPI0014481B19|nr:glycosyltransferase family 2 protein [Anabaena sp. UHCC 0187]MTJ11410.1 glycosyltransferase [Anabaena sp. UHCC 0187]
MTDQQTIDPLLSFPQPQTDLKDWVEKKEIVFPEITQNSSQFPRISIITPSYNQGNFIEETIRSVLLQGYPNLEYIIIDGGSTDNTIEILKKYEKHLAYWVSEPDNGQTHAINKGLAKATGDIIAYLNSDDYYLPGILFKVAEYFSQFPETDLLHGICRYVNQEGEKIGEQFGNIQTLEEILDLWDVWWKKRQFVQPEVFWTRRITEKIGLFKEQLFFVMDYDYWCRIIQAGGIVKRIDSELSCFRFTDEQKSNQSQKVANELLELVRPILWDKNVNISLKKRLILQGKWLYKVKLLNQIEQSVNNNDVTLIRWLKSLKVIVQFPQILLVPSLHIRFKHLLTRQNV